VLLLLIVLDTNSATIIHNGVVYNWIPEETRASEIFGTELVDKSPRAVGLANDAFAIILSYRATQFVVVHRGAVLASAPQPCDVRRVFDLEDSCQRHQWVVNGDMCMSYSVV